MIKLYKPIVFFFLVFVLNLNVSAQVKGYALPISNATSVVGYKIFEVANFANKQVSNFTNYPNPASLRTTVSYTLSAKTKVNLRVIDLAGKQLAVLVKADQSAGKHEFEWEFANNNISAGMYILVLQVDSKTYTRKVIVQ
ncbi:MAG: T9SS type A sorting domain-containing protein [Pedobacter sp.]|nr:MAG: T9SS type A sorting domain-containing protein [Pedobacter sp.]